jgi:hypothetical protein
MKTTGAEGKKMDMGSRHDAMCLELQVCFSSNFFTLLIFILELTSTPANGDLEGRWENLGDG